MKKNYIYGIRTVIEAIDSGQIIEKILFRKDLNGQLFNELFAIVKNNNIPFQFVPAEKINRLSQKNHQGVIAFISLIEYTDIEQLTQMVIEEGKVPLFLFLDGITDVRNFGSIARTAECAGVHAIVIKEKGSAQINEDAIKTSAGALFKIPVARVFSFTKLIRFLKDSGFRIVSATEKGSVNYFEVDYTLPTAIIMGAEDVGVSVDLLKMSDFTVKIPILGEIESLNVANATSVIVYEAVKQRLTENK
ncbi:MAG: 23S rRNA (guanosine(2251)-2'-O)-methyltransferase RlmB [Bacteroidales bacterium]|nr:23S rRNA (guanosine(2251)-2'-O)-methyltransferase RlmB [Bacteroidales bacterium]